MNYLVWFMLGGFTELRSNPKDKVRVRCEVGKWFKNFISFKDFTRFFLETLIIFLLFPSSFSSCSQGGASCFDL